MLLTTSEVAEKLRVSKQTISVLVKTKKINAVRIGNLLRFEPEEIDRYISKGGDKNES